MATSKPPHSLTSLPPHTDEIDASWDDDPVDPDLGDDPDPSPYERPTVTPSEPTEDYAARLMAETEPGAAEDPQSQEVPTSQEITERGLQPVPPPDAEYLSPPRVPVFDGSAMPRPPSEPPISLPGSADPSPITQDMLPISEPSDRHKAVTPAANPAASPDQVPTEPPERRPPSRGQTPGGVSLELDPEGTGPSPLELADSHPRSSAPPPAPSPLELAVDPKADDNGGSADGGGDALADMKDRYAVGDFTGALVIAESVLETDPEDIEARRYAQSCREVLTQMYAARLGALDQIVSVAIPADQIRWLSLDHRAGFLLSLVDGMSSIEEILDVSGMSRLDALRIMYTLVQQRVIALEAPAGG